MSRPLRIQYPGAWYHVMNRGRRGESIFPTDNWYRAFVDLLEETAEMWNIRIASFCLIPNHYHLLVQTPEGNLSRAMRHIDGVYTQRFNRANKLDGPHFRGRYKSILVEGDPYLLQLVRYIHRNPLRAGLTKGLDDYLWSSHGGYISRTKMWDWLHKEFIFSLLTKDKGSRLNAYRLFMAEEEREEILKVVEGNKWPTFLGIPSLVSKTKEKFFPLKVHDEVPQSQDLVPEWDRIRQAVCAVYGVEEKTLMTSKRGWFNEPRNVAIYVSRRLRRDTLKEIGEQFGLGKYSSVSSVVDRMKRLVTKDGNLGRRVEKILSNLSKSQEQT